MSHGRPSAARHAALQELWASVFGGREKERNEIPESGICKGPMAGCSPPAARSLPRTSYNSRGGPKRRGATLKKRAAHPVYKKGRGAAEKQSCPFRLPFPAPQARITLVSLLLRTLPIKSRAAHPPGLKWSPHMSRTLSATFTLWLLPWSACTAEA